MSSLLVYAQVSQVLSLPFPSEPLCGGLSLVSTLGRLSMVFVGLTREHLEVTYEPLWLLYLVAQAFECSLVNDPQATVLCEQTSQVCSLINHALQVLSAPTNGAHEREEDTAEDLHMVLTRTIADTHKCSSAYQ